MPGHVMTRVERESWYLMRHLDPEYIDRQLQLVNERREFSGSHAFLYLVPYQFIRRVKPTGEDDKNVRSHNDLRTDFHDYVFIKATEKEIDGLLHEQWNREGRLHLSYCRSYSGTPLRVAPDEMDMLMRLFIDHYERFNFVPVSPGRLLEEKVRLKTGFFTSRQVSVVKIQYAQKGISLTLGLPLFNGNFMLEMKDQTLADIEVPDHLQKVLDPDFVRTVEHDLAAILRKRIKGISPVGTAGQGTDSEKLNTYYILNYLESADTVEDGHLRTLMLLCASLRKDERGVHALLPVVEGLLGGRREAVTDEDAFILAVLFVATHDISYRRAAKLYEQTHEDISEPLSLLMPIIKDIKVRSTKKKTSRKLEKIVRQQSRLTLQQIQECDFGSLAPRAVKAVGDILALPRYQTAEGLRQQARLRESMAAYGPFPPSQPVAPATFEQMRSNLLRSRPADGDTLTAYYQALVRLYPGRETPDSKDLYEEFFSQVLRIYPDVRPCTTDWWQLKAILEHHYSTMH